MKAWLLIFLAVAMPAHAGDVTNDVPDAMDTSRVHLIYLQGRIIENSGLRPIDARFGLYDYPAVLEALSSRGAIVISTRRGPDTDVNAYAGVVISVIERLLLGGVPAEQIVIAGFSKGGLIAVHVSSFLRRSQVRFVLLAACWDRPHEPQLRLTGRVLSVYETSDTLAGSCKRLGDHPEQPQSFEEIMISTGKAHGAFYLPHSTWVDPVLDWVHGDGG